MSLHEKTRSVILSKLVSDENQKIGIEEECIIYNAKNQRLPVNHSSHFSASDLLSIINQKNKKNGSYSLEPGGQLEWASPPLKDLHSINEAFNSHKELRKKIINQYDLKIINYGVEPEYMPDSIELIDDLKYQLMNDRFEKNGTMGKWMMRNTASIQINFDTASEREMEEMVFIADCLQPISAYLFSNSPYQNGSHVGNKNLRNLIWENTDNIRCRNLIDHGIITSSQLIDKYIEYIFKVPGIFELDKSGLCTQTVKTLGGRLSELDQNNDLREIDILAALHQIFTNVRLKNLVEVRGSDRTPIGFELAPVAFWTGLLTVDSIRAEVLKVVRKWTIKERYNFNEISLYLDNAQIGPKGMKYQAWNEWAAELALSGLKLRNLDEGIYFENFYNIIKSSGPFSTQTKING